MKALGIHDRPGEKRRAFFLALGFVLLTWAAWSAAASVPAGASLSASLEKDAARTGEELWLTLRYDLPEGARLPENPVVDGIEILTVVERVVSTGKIKLRFLVDRLESFETGPIGLTFIDNDGNEQRIETEAVIVSVLSNLGEKPEEAALRPIQDILSITPKWLPYLPWAVVAVVLLCLMIAWLRWRRKRCISRSAEAAIDLPHILAEKEIDHLEAAGLFEGGDVKAYYFQFSEIIRRYMGAIRHFPAIKMTTEEIGRQVGNHFRDQEVVPMLRQADLVKFADTVPTRDNKEQNVQAARAYIRQTSPEPAEVRENRNEAAGGS